MAKKPASKRKQQPAEEQEPPQARSSEVRKAISQQKLRSLLSSSRKARQNISEISGELGSEIKTAAEKNHLHRKAFRVCVQADAMEPEKLAEFLDCLDHYLDISGLRDRASQVQRMEFGPGDASEDEDEDNNVRNFPMPHGQAAE